MKSLVLPLAVCAALSGCVAYPYGHQPYGGHPYRVYQAPTAPVPAAAGDAVAQPSLVPEVAYPAPVPAYPYAAPYGYPSPYPYASPEPYAYDPYYYSPIGTRRSGWQALRGAAGAAATTVTGTRMPIGTVATAGAGEGGRPSNGGGGRRSGGGRR